MTTYSGDPNDSTDDTPFDALKDKSLKAAGVAYLVGDAALFASGMMAGRGKEAASGLMWGVGGLACAQYANPNADKQLELLSDRLAHYLRKEGVEIPRTPDTAALTKPEGVIEKIEAFLYTNPSQVLNATYGIGGVQLLRSGLQHGKRWDMASGALVTAGALAGLLVTEKEADSDHPPQGLVGKAVEWVQQKPLRLSGALYGLNNATLIMSALNEHKTNPAQKSYIFKFMTAASYILGNSLLAMSSKKHTSHSCDSDKAMGQLATASATVINSQPPELREALVQQISAYLSSQPEVSLSASDIAAKLHAKLHETVAAHNTGSWSKRVGDSLNPSASPAL